MSRSALVTGVLAVAGLGAVVAGVMQLVGGGAVAVEPRMITVPTAPPTPTPFLTMGEKLALGIIVVPPAVAPAAMDSADVHANPVTPSLRPIRTAPPARNLAPEAAAPVITVPAVPVISESRAAPADRAPSGATRRK